MSYQYIRSLPLFTIILFAIISCTKSFTTIPSIQISSQLHNLQRRRISSALSTASVSSDGGEQSSAVPRKPQTFREGEIMGLRLMQDGRHEDALNGMRMLCVFLCILFRSMHGEVYYSNHAHIHLFFY